VSERASHPVGGVDYPRTIQEFDQWFASEPACQQFLQRLRWPTGFLCPTCQGTKSWLTARGQLHCSACQRPTSPTAGTVFEGTRKPLRTWFQAMWYVTNQKNGGSALGLQRLLGLRSYQTAWSWLHKLRRAMVRPGRDRLRGLVEVDETYVGGIEEGAAGRQITKKALVAIAIEILSPRGFGRVRLRQIPNASAPSLKKFVGEAVEPGSTVHTDGWAAYNDITKLGYARRISVLAKSGEPAHAEMPGVHRVASLLKRWLLGTHQGAVSRKHLDFYLDEFAFRFNRRTSKARGLLFYRLVQQAVQVEPTHYATLVADTGHKR
jgi:transposase-like protein